MNYFNIRKQKYKAQWLFAGNFGNLHKKDVLVDIKLILTYEPALPIEATATEVKKHFHGLQVTHLPVLKNKQFAGCISLEDSQTIEEDKNLSDYLYLLSKIAIADNASWMDILQEFSRNDTNMLPVLDLNHNYLGYLELEDFIHALGRMPFLNEPGATLVIETASHHYSTSEVSQIVESNNGKIMGLFVTALNDNQIECTIKLNSNSINEITQTFRRYGYEIKSEHIEDTYVEGLKERSKYLTKFLNI